jgi:signal transduction histidine kinase
MHDIKNLVSQLSLVARNAERHADNPEFREDMIATLQSSVKKMNDLLARLARGGARGRAAARDRGGSRSLAAIAEVKRAGPSGRVSGEQGSSRDRRSGRLEQALAHLVQNAIDASPAGVRSDHPRFESGGEVAIEVIDRGAGMSAEFIRTRLFQPFASTKEAASASAPSRRAPGRRHGRPDRGRQPRRRRQPLHRLFTAGAEMARPLTERMRA